jgi:integrase/recombinase XerD
MKGCRPLNRGERAAALSACKDDREGALLALGFATGYRISELLSLRIGDVIDARGNPLRHVAVKAANTKTKEGRTVLLNTSAGKAVVALCKALLARGHSRTTPLFIGRKSSLVAIGRIQAWRLLRALFERAEIAGSVATHTMRKTFAAECYRLLGGAIEKVARALGHKSITSTVSYLSFNESEIDDALMAFE